MDMDLYHVELGLPEGFVLPTRTVGLLWTRHAKQASANDRYGAIPWWETLDLSACRVIEVGIEGRKVRKVVVRTELDPTNDVIYVLIPNGLDPWVVKTVWINRKRDSHKTLDRSRYVC